MIIHSFLTPLKTLNDVLQKAHDGSTVNNWFYYLATTDYASAPQKKPGGGGQEGTKAPIDQSFKSPFVGDSEVDVARWLQQKPEGVDLDGVFFAVLDKKAETGSVALCRIGDRDGKGEEVSCVLVKTEESSLTLAGMEYGEFDELLRGRRYVPDI